MKNAFEYLHKVICWIMAIIMIAITALTFYQVVCRYVFNNASSWSEELIRYLFIWVSVFGSAVGIHEHIHIGIDVVVNRFPVKVRDALHILTQLAIIAMCVLLVIYGVKMVGMAALQTSPALKLSMKYVYMAAPVGGVLMIIYLLKGIVNDFRDIVKGGKSDA